MDQLLPVINKLQDVFQSVGLLDTIDLPQIAVVGSQSSGKSSVLEHVVGRDFLPRGTGIVTRVPLVLQLINTPKNEKNKDGDEWGEFLHTKTKKFYDFNEIRNEIVNETNKICGKNKGVSNISINLRIYSPNVLNLTLIDLPGITKIPVGDQPSNIEELIKKMILQFISKQNCIIFAVSPANIDLANSDALKLAREVDPKGERTVGVITKIDLMDKGTDCMDILTGKQYPLKRGYIGVSLRGQFDIENGKKINDALKDEAKFFENHSVYSKIGNKIGTQYLAKTMNTILLGHIRFCLPDIKNKISGLIQQAQKRLTLYGDSENENMSEGATLLNLLNKFSTNYINLIEGKNENENKSNELFGGSRINHIFTQKYTPYLIKLDACDNLSEEDIKLAIKNSKGPKSSLFIPEAAFETLVKNQIKMLLSPSLQCVDQVYEELIIILDFAEKVNILINNRI
jgi:replication fork clamp-binding protein CrfC